jgi:hypothetical protein
MVSTLRGKATNIGSRGSRAQSIPGFRGTEFANIDSIVDNDPLLTAAPKHKTEKLKHSWRGDSDTAPDQSRDADYGSIA